jgi:hypothetical protein
MNPGRLLKAICILAMAASACAPRQIRPVSEIDPAPMLETVAHRRNALEKGISGLLETDFKKGGQRYRGKAYITVFPDGPFRLEIPGFMGSTAMVMVNNGQEVTAYYPEERKAYLSLTDGLSINPHLPFPLPVKTDLLTALLMGTVPKSYHISEAGAFLLDSGEKQLWSKSDQDGMTFKYLFTEGPAADLMQVNASRPGLEMEVTTQRKPPYLPESFALIFQESTIKGDWEKVAVFNGDRTVLLLNVPASVPITDLR